MKKICYIVTIPFTIKSFFIEQLNYLAEHGFDVTVICSPSEDLQNLLDIKIKFIPLEIPRGLSIVGSIKCIINLKRIFKKEQFDLIQYSTPNAAFYSSFASWLEKVKIRNYHLMGLRFDGFTGLSRFVYKKLEKLTCSFSTNIECVSPSLLSASLKYNLFSADKGKVVWNGSTGGVSLTRFDISYKEQWRKEIRNNLNISEDTLVFGFVGRITKDKGINELLAAFQRIVSKKDNVLLLLIGNFENRCNLDPKLLGWAEHSNAVSFINNVSNVEKYYSALDTLVLPSYREGFGNVIIEAEAMGVPVIVTDIPGPIDAIIKNSTGIVVEVKNVDTIVEGMEKMYNDDFRKDCSENAVEFARTRFDSKILCEKILERKRELLEWNK